VSVARISKTKSETKNVYNKLVITFYK